MMVDDQMYWGNDRLDFLDEWLAATGESQGSL
jgi:2-hydroxychromene-2-carboxylate isomerase